MRTPVLVAATAAAVAFGAAAEAVPLAVVAPPVAGPVVRIADGCGYRFHRGIYGRCVANGVRVLPLYKGTCVRRMSAFGWRLVCH